MIRTANLALFMFIIFILISPMCIKAESARSDDVVTFSKTFGGDKLDEGISIQQTADGGYIILGETVSFASDSGDYIWLIKTDDNGNKIWDNTYAGNWARSLSQTADGGYAILGHGGDFLKEEIFLIRTDAFGNEIWTKEFGASSQDFPHDVQQTKDGGFVVVGMTSLGEGDVWLIKTDDNGNEEWTKHFGDDQYQEGESIQQTTDGGYIIVGASSSYERYYDVWLIKADRNGNKLWDQKYGGHRKDWGYSVRETSEGGYIIAATTSSFGAGNTDAWIIKTNSSGSELWNQTYGSKNDDYVYCIQETNDKGYVIAGKTGKKDEKPDIWIVKTDENGIVQWERTYGGDEADIGKTVLQTTDGGYIIVGGTGSFGSGVVDLWLIKTNTEGQTIDSTNGGNDHPNVNNVSTSKFPWLWIAIGAGAIILIAVIIIIIRRRNDDEWDDEDEDDEDYEDEEVEKVRRKPSKPPQKRCIKCSAVLISPDAVFCTTCGASQTAVSAPAPSPQTINCPGCGGVNAHGTAFCGMCGMNLQQSLGVVPPVPMVQQVPVMQQPASHQFVQQPQTQAPVQPMAQQGFVQQQQVFMPTPMFPQQQQNPPAPPPPVPPGYGGLQ